MAAQSSNRHWPSSTFFNPVIAQTMPNNIIHSFDEVIDACTSWASLPLEGRILTHSFWCTRPKHANAGNQVLNFTSYSISSRVSLATNYQNARDRVPPNGVLVASSWGQDFMVLLVRVFALNPSES